MDLEQIATNAYESSEKPELSEQEKGAEEKTEAPISNEDNTENSQVDKDKTENKENTENKEIEEKEEKEENKNTELENKEIDFESEAKKRGYIKKDDIEQELKSKADKQQTLEAINARPEEIGEEQWSKMPAVNKLIYKSLPYIETTGKDGKTYKVKDTSQLPDDFEFLNDKERARFTTEMQAQENRATEKISAIQHAQDMQNSKQQQQQNAQQVIEDVQQLQKENIIPQFKAKPNTPEFDKDKSVILINKILAYQEQRTKAGRPISTYDAALSYKSLHPDDFNFNKATEADLERKRISSKIGSSDGGNRKDGQTHPNFNGWSAEDIADYYSKDLD